MTTMKTDPAIAPIDEATRKLTAALEALRGNPNMPIERARAIYGCAINIIDTVKIEAHQSTINRGKQ